MDRTEAVRALVLNELCDDYEEPEQILKQVRCDAIDPVLSADELRQALVSLVGTGLAKAYRSTATRNPPEEIAWNGESGVYFYITELGRRFLAEIEGVWDKDDNMIWRDPDS